MKPKRIETLICKKEFKNFISGKEYVATWYEQNIALVFDDINSIRFNTDNRNKYVEVVTIVELSKYLYDYFYTKEELRFKKLESL
ncbi:hypothetical protein M0Q50_09545 [bacterium]|jgi:hypothetical protein|nr:hypothetical protein [bacterium]